MVQSESGLKHDRETLEGAKLLGDEKEASNL